MKKVLVIDDTAEVRELVVAVLNSHDFETLCAEEGRTGIELAKTHLPDLVLCDVRMPGMDGYTVLSELRSEPITATIPFIFLSGAVDKTDMRQGMQLGADDYLTKPFTFEELIGAVQSRLKKQAAVVQLTEKKLVDLRDNISLALPHELLTPLHGILGLSTLMIEDYQNMKPQEILEYARNIHDSGLRLNRLIENFLAYSRIEIVSADPEKIAAVRQGAQIQILQPIQEISRRAAEKVNRQQDLQLNVQDARLPIQAEHFRKIVEELVDNAFKFSKPGTPVEINTALRDHTAQISFSDVGRGLTSEQIARVGAHMQFDRKFYEQQGSGLGLIIAKRMTELYGGRLSIESTPNVKTTVTVSFNV